MDFMYEIEDVLPKEICEIIIKRYQKDIEKESAVGKGWCCQRKYRKSKYFLYQFINWKDVDSIMSDVISLGINKYTEAYFKKNGT